MPRLPERAANRRAGGRAALNAAPQTGVSVKGVGGLYYARGEQGTVSVLRAKGIFRKRHLTPLVGDHILFTPGEGEEHGWIEEILPRQNEKNVNGTSWI